MKDDTRLRASQLFVRGHRYSTISDGRCYDCELGWKRLTRHISQEWKGMGGTEGERGREPETKRNIRVLRGTFLFLVVTSTRVAGYDESRRLDLPETG